MPYARHRLSGIVANSFGTPDQGFVGIAPSGGGGNHQLQLRSSREGRQATRNCSWTMLTWPIWCAASIRLRLG